MSLVVCLYSSLGRSSRNSDRYRVVRLLGPQSAENTGRKCLVLDLDETLVHSSFQAVPNPDYIIPVNIDNTIHNVYVLKRPGVDEFMRRMGEHYEVVIFTASLSKYADPLLDELDVGKVISKRLFRESCVLHEGHYVKDLSLLNRDVSQCIIVDNSQMSYSFHPENAIDCFSYIDDPKDVEMWEIADFLENIKNVKDVRYFCRYLLSNTSAALCSTIHFYISTELGRSGVEITLTAVPRRGNLTRRPLERDISQIFWRCVNTTVHNDVHQNYYLICV